MIRSMHKISLNVLLNFGLFLRKNIILLHVRRSDTTFYIYFKNIFLWEQFSVHIALVVQLVGCYDIVKVGYDVLLHILDE